MKASHYTTPRSTAEAFGRPGIRLPRDYRLADVALYMIAIAALILLGALPFL